MCYKTVPSRARGIEKTEGYVTESSNGTKFTGTWKKKRNIIKEWEYFKSDETYGKIPGCSGN